MHGLEMPHDLSRRCSNSDDGVRIVIVADAFTAKVVRARAAGWNEDKVAR